MGMNGRGDGVGGCGVYGGVCGPVADFGSDKGVVDLGVVGV